MKAISDRRRREKPARDAARAEVFARDGERCQFANHVRDHIDSLTQEDVDFFNLHRKCWGPLEMHEPAHSGNVGRTNVPRSRTACRGHNRLAENEPELCRKIGWAESGVGEPIRKWAMFR